LVLKLSAKSQDFALTNAVTFVGIV